MGLEGCVPWRDGSSALRDGERLMHALVRAQVLYEPGQQEAEEGNPEGSRCVEKPAELECPHPAAEARALAVAQQQPEHGEPQQGSASRALRRWPLTCR